MQNTLATIARQHLGLETLETRNSDSLDFRDQAVWSIKAALEAAYNAGAGEGSAGLLVVIYQDGERRQFNLTRGPAGWLRRELLRIGEEIATTATYFAKSVLITEHDVLTYTAGETAEVLGLD